MQEKWSRSDRENRRSGHDKRGLKNRERESTNRDEEDENEDEDDEEEEGRRKSKRKRKDRENFRLGGSIRSARLIQATTMISIDDDDEWGSPERLN